VLVISQNELTVVTPEDNVINGILVVNPFLTDHGDTSIIIPLFSISYLETVLNFS
jgi:hypothetical protein